MLEGHVAVEVDVEVLVGVDAADLLEAQRPDRPRHHQVLLHAVALVRAQQLSVHEVNPDLQCLEKTINQGHMFCRIFWRVRTGLI